MQTELYTVSVTFSKSVDDLHREKIYYIVTTKGINRVIELALDRLAESVTTNPKKKIIRMNVVKAKESIFISDDGT